MPAPYAFVTLLTSDAYLPGALAQVAALHDLHPKAAREQEQEQRVEFDTLCVVTPETVDVSCVKVLRRAFDVVLGVEIIDQHDERNLQLLGRPDLAHALTKLHVFRLIEYTKVIFLDADVLPIRPLSHLFTLPHDFSAVPDVGWPDIFNSGVMVFSPGEDKFKQLMDLNQSKGSWDGADQGLLNEWRGDNWNRLSFTYNTTPTAAYTYAPAYERFGSKISAIHFIGPNKPWNSIPWRGPSSESFQKQVMSNAQPVYDYSSLVDRWFAVYDKHFRSSLPLTEAEFEVRHYPAAWDEGTSLGAEILPTSQPADASQRPTNALGLEDLKRIAIEGVAGTFAGLKDNVRQEGVYRSMPLEGRVDLMRPKREPRPEPKAPHTAGSHHLPPTQYGGQDSSAGESSQEDQGPGHYPGHHHHSQHHGQHRHEQHGDHHQQSGHHHHHHHGPPRPASPPKVSWNPALEPPPSAQPPPSTFPTDTYFSNAWDHSQHQHHRQTSETQPDAFFHAPPPAAIPQQLINQGHYAHIMGSAHSNGGTVSPSSVPAPNPAKVKTMFPWEEKPRHYPRRVFPDADAPPPSSEQYIQPTVPAAVEPEENPGSPTPTGHRSPELAPSPSVHTPGSFSRTLSFANAWDSVPEIKKYASHLARPEPPSHMPSFDDSRARRNRLKAWDERVELADHETDAEDEGDDEATDEDGPGPSDGESESGRSSGARRVRRRAVSHDAGAGGSGTRSPSTFLVYSGTGTASPRFAPSSTPDISPPQAHQIVRTPSNSSSSVGPVSPEDPMPGPAIDMVGGDSPVHMPVPLKKTTGRVWDPARGVDVFKRGSEEVLARFLRMGPPEAAGGAAVGGSPADADDRGSI